MPLFNSSDTAAAHRHAVQALKLDLAACERVAESDTMAAAGGGPDEAGASAAAPVFRPPRGDVVVQLLHRHALRAAQAANETSGLTRAHFAHEARVWWLLNALFGKVSGAVALLRAVGPRGALSCRADVFVHRQEYDPTHPNGIKHRCQPDDVFADDPDGAEYHDHIHHREALGGWLMVCVARGCPRQLPAVSPLSRLFTRRCCYRDAAASCERRGCQAKRLGRRVGQLGCPAHRRSLRGGNFPR